MRVIIAGSRDFNDFIFLEKKCDEILFNESTEDLKFVCGMARGADLLGKKYADKHGYNVKSFYPDWDRYGKSAGYRRNEQMASYAKEDNGILIAFWDGVSKGTKHMIDLGNKYGLRVYVVNYSEGELNIK